MHNLFVILDKKKKTQVRNFILFLLRFFVAHSMMSIIIQRILICWI